MRTASFITMIVIGAILTFALNIPEISPYVSLDAIGWILMAGGAFGLLWIIIASRRSQVRQTSTSYDPQSNSETTRYESRNEF